MKLGKGSVIVGILGLALAGAGFFFGQKWAKTYFATPAVAEASVPAGTSEVDAGEFSFNMDQVGLPVIMHAKVSVHNPAPDRDRIQNDIQTMLTNIAEMPLAMSEGLDEDRIEEVMLWVAKQEAPWLDAVTLTPMNEGHLGPKAGIDKITKIPPGEKKAGIDKILH